ncbi:hypothetical protein [Sediminibacterium sp. C3]|uniref:hypothetical protein n=1 Tax=Sediminibacterium sp. C3 TaxID=1267211 RepID=UPI000425A43F|nr:hypothetical protein [Sediminibacterium sp. C3]
MTGTCKLYDLEEDLRESHIYPKFIIDYFRSTGSKFMRSFTEPNRRMQDGIKLYLLSEKAEQKFSTSEKWFAENIFRPYQDQNQKTLVYNDNLYYFSLSFLWRILLLNLSDPEISKQPYYKLLCETQADWKLFLRDYKYPQFDRIYLFLTDRVVSHNLDIKGVDYYMTRALDGTIVSNDSNTFIAVYGKFLKFAFWGVLKGANDEAKIADLRINPTTGNLKTPQNFEDQTMISFFYNRIKQLDFNNLTSDKQQEKILKEVMKDKESFLYSDAGKSILNDLQNLDKKNGC